MLTKFRARISSAHVLAAVAMFMALGGAAYAVKSNSVGSKQLKKNAVTTKKIKKRAVKTAKLADNAATGAKVNEASLSKVPHAEKADTATSATSAVGAINSIQLGGFGVAQVRGTAAGTGNGTAVDLPAMIATPVLSQTVAIPAGGADLVATASVGLKTDAATATEASCMLQANPGGQSVNMTADFPATDDYNVVVPLSLTADHVLPAGGNAEVRVLCGTAAGGDTSYVEGNLSVAVVPDQA